VTARLERFHETKLLFGRDASEDSGALGDFGKFCVGDFFKLTAGEGDQLPVLFAALQSDLPGDGAGR
jgi:hypothetical protein